MLASIAAAHTPDLIIITGGMVSRDLTLTSENALTSIASTLAKVAAVFPAI
jgi:predicted MPP superfamily phosphohydrolase